jgi:sialate O-acetylesterase
MKAILFCPLVIFGFTSFAQIKLPRLISDGMVLQRDAEVKLWGWAAPNEKIQLEFSGKQFNAHADASGHWLIILPKQDSSSFPMPIISKNQTKM